MKRYIRTTPIFGMATSRSDAIHRVESLKDALDEHLCKCVIYHDSLQCLDHWVKEIASFFDRANQQTLKNSKKLDIKTYQSALFGQFGDARADKENALRYFAVLHMKGEYPKVAVTVDMVDELCFCVRELERIICPILAQKNDYEPSDFVMLIEDIFDKAGLFD